MDTLRFEWDENKNAINRKKHKISFEEAQTVFYDEAALLIDDRALRGGGPVYYSRPEQAGKYACGLSLLQSTRRRHTHHLCQKGNQNRSHAIQPVKEASPMKAEYDFSNARKNPYAKKLKKQVTINLDIDAIDFFKTQAAASGIPYQTLINLYLSDCAAQGKTLRLTWI